MNGILGIGMTMALSFGGVASCGGESKPPGVEITALQDVTVYKQPNAITNPSDRVGVLRVGKRAMASCYFKSATLAVDSVRVENSVDGYSFIFSHDSSGNLTDNFNVSPEVLRENLDSCD